MTTLSKSKLLAFRQCPKRFWLEMHRKDLLGQSAGDTSRLAAGHQVGEMARRILDPSGTGVLVDIDQIGFDGAITLTEELLRGQKPIFEACLRAAGGVVFADIMLPLSGKGLPAWRLIEVKSSTSVKEHHRDDVAIQCFVAQAAGVALESVVVATIDSGWTYPGNGDYRGLLRETSLTEEAMSRRDEVCEWVVQSRAIALRASEPLIETGSHCHAPYECPFYAYCTRDRATADFPVEWIPRPGKALKEAISSGSIRDMREVADDLLNKVQLRVKAATLSGTPYFDVAATRAALAQQPLPAYFLDFETINMPVPIWPGTRPYQQIPFQFSLHVLTEAGHLEHRGFLDLSGEDPSYRLATSLIDACGSVGAIYAYNAAFERARIGDLAERFAQLAEPLLAINERIVDLLPLARDHFYHPIQQGSWSIKNVLPAIAPEISYQQLDGVKDGGMAMDAYAEAIHPTTAQERKAVIYQQLSAYCELDTLAMVRIWEKFTGRIA